MLFAAGRKARAYEEIGYYRAQGDNAASPNPPMGALLTYYLREDAQSGTRVVLSVTDATGRQVRQLDAVAKAGLHRTPWDLREASIQVQGGRGVALTRPPTAEGGDEAAPPTGRGGRGFGRGGPLVKPGSYTVTLGKLANGQIAPLGQPQIVEVAPLEW
jgi:hypothetical protein